MIPISVDLELVSNLAITDTQTLLESTNIPKEKVVFIAGYLSHKHFQEGEIEDEELVTSDFLKELSRGGLRVPTLNMVFLVHSATSMYETLKEPYRRCTKYFRSSLGFIDTPFSRNIGVCKRLTNVIFKGDVLHRSDRENQLGCLRRKEKLSQSSTSPNNTLFRFIILVVD